MPCEDDFEPDIQSVNSLTDHMLFCKSCCLRARWLAKGCMAIAMASDSLKLDKETMGMIESVLSVKEFKALEEIIYYANRNQQIVNELEICFGQENKYDPSVLRRNFILTPLRKLAARTMIKDPRKQ